MEFPDLGKHCSEKTCKQLDFLPLKCDACKQDFCKDHFTCAAHRCPFAFKKDVQVPVCPLCNIPIPVKKGEIPDVVVGDHIDRDCKHPGKNKKKIFTFQCSKEGCKKKEMLQVACDQCHGNFCIQHRHPLDHNCRHESRPSSKAGCSLVRTAESKPSGPLNTLSSSWLAQQFRYQSRWHMCI
ncbi:AN1-type zinc finger protein 2A isoform X1 [Nycticebus coucang]|uniref:AN1-type zinc finger protein 2A isoform X1 n=2 Tax=Nycticebus coucang TaxID=9470 RepID=UPI00234CF370|nr:AN1-type zinc finger protein 2A isoform X1 [Nycticebus coucang]